MIFFNTDDFLIDLFLSELGFSELLMFKIGLTLGFSSGGKNRKCEINTIDTYKLNQRKHKKMYSFC